MRTRAWLRMILLAASAAATNAQDVFLIPFSHLDLYWAGTREECLARGNTIIAKAVQLAKRYPEYRFLLEDEVFVSNYVESHKGSPELADFRRFVKEGRIEVSPKWAGIYQNGVRGEAHVRNFLAGKTYARSVLGVDPQMAQLGDLPGYTPQFPQILAKSATPFTVMTRMGPPDQSLFRWKAPDGTTALTWHAIKGYHWGAAAGLHRDLDEKRLSQLAADLKEVKATTAGPIAMHWGLDLWAPSEKVIQNLDVLNRRFAPMRFRFATPLDFFRAAERGSGLPELAGDIPPAWSNLASALNEIWPLSTAATDALLTAEKFAAINHALGQAAYPQEQFNFLWKKLLESMDHNHSGQGGQIAGDRKTGYAQLVRLSSEQITRDMLRNIAERVEIPFRPSHPIVVFNPLGWQRDDLVRAHVTLYGDVATQDIQAFRKGMRLVDQSGNAVPFAVEETSENISLALDLVFVARAVPSLGYRTYYLTPAEEPGGSAKTAGIDSDSDRDRKNANRPLGHDVLETEFFRLDIDKATGRIAVYDKQLQRDIAKDVEIVGVEERGGNSIGIEPLTGRVFARHIREVAVEQNNAVRAVVRIAGTIADIPITQRVTIYRGLKRIDLENSVDWPGERYLRLEQVIPHGIERPQVRYGIPFGANSAGNLIPNSGPHFPDEMNKDAWLKTRQIMDWISASADDWGLTMASDHQLTVFDPGAIRAVMIRGTRFSLERVVRGGKATSYQKPPAGTYTFRYTLIPHAGSWKQVRSHQAGLAFNNPLIPVSATDEISTKSSPPSRSFCFLNGDNLVITALKKAERGNSVVLRFVEVEGGSADAAVNFLDGLRPVRELNLIEDEISSTERPRVTVKPYEIKTVEVRVRP